MDGSNEISNGKVLAVPPAWSTFRPRETRLLIAFLVFLCLPSFAWAAGFDCGKATTVPEKVICANPTLSELDGKMTTTFERARKHAGARADALRRSQVIWLAGRNQLIWLERWLASRQNGPSGVSGLENLYNERIALLEHPFKEPTSPLLVAILAQAAVAPTTSDEWKALSGNGTVFGMAQKYEGSLEEITKRMSVDFDASPALTSILTKVEGATTLVKLDRAQMGGIYATAGTLYCDSWLTLFRWQARTVEPLDVPETLDDGDMCYGRGSGELVIFQNQVYAIRIHTSMDHLDIRAQPYTGNGWGEAERLVLSYDRALPLPESHCRLGNCGELIAQARDVIERYDRRRDEAALITPLSTEQKKRFEAMRRAAEADEDTGNDDSLKTLPEFGAEQFADTAVYFPLRHHGEVLLARIGNARTRDHISENFWLLATWRLNGAWFRPVLGMEAPVQRGNFLFGTSVPLPDSP